MILREINRDDYPYLVNLFNSLYPYYSYTIEDIKYDYEIDRGKYKKYAYVAEINKEIVGLGEFSLMKYYQEGLFYIKVYVRPDKQKQGIGNSIYNFLLNELKKLNAKSLVTYILSEHKNGIDFAIKKGFNEVERYYELELNVNEANVNELEESLRNVTKEGIEIINLNEKIDYFKLYQLIIEILRDIPSPFKYTPLSFNEWKEDFLKNPYRINEAFFIAKYKDNYIGLSSLSKENNEIVNQGLTGIIKEYRNKGIAKALKLKIINYAKEKKYKIIRTWNSSVNIPILNLNKKIGFKIKREWITFLKEI